MAGEWREMTFGDCAVVVRDTVAPAEAGDAPYIGLEHIGEGSLALNGHGLASDVTSAKSRFRRGDILFGKLRPYFRKVIRASFDGVCSTDIWVVRPRAHVDAGFLFYWMASQEFVDASTRGSEGTKMPRAQLEFVSRFTKSIPPLPEQRAIAHILGTLDNKIELNRRMNETLESMARALFKSWFVDFDPVRAKAEGRDTGLPKELAGLFPDSFQRSELGDIPRGWRVAPLADCVEVARGLSYKGSGLSHDGLPMHNLNSIYEGGGYKHDGLKYYQGEYKPHHVARAGDLIVANTEQGHHRLLIGYAAVVPSCFDGESLFSHHIYRVRPKNSSGLTSDYLCKLLNTRVMHDTVSGYANGTTVNMLPIDGLQSPLILVPPSQVVATFNDSAEAARKRHEEMVEESRTLAALRDTLLPKLVSGDIPVQARERTA